MQKISIIYSFLFILFIIQQTKQAVLTTSLTNMNNEETETVGYYQLLAINRKYFERFESRFKLRMDKR